MPKSNTLLAAFVACVACVAFGAARVASAQPADAVPPAPAETTAPPEATAPPVEAPPVAAADDLDLATLGLDPVAAFDDKLTLYGFADFTYQRVSYGPDSLLTGTQGFLFGNLNMYVAKNLTRRWRTLVEVRFMFAPNGAYEPDGDITSTTTEDPANLYRPIEWGGIRIERAYLEYDLHPRLTIRAGHWLSPYGIWNVDHGSPTIVSTFKPYVIGEEFIPEHQTGIHAFGAVHAGEYKLGYHATLSNGRSSVEATEDPDGRPALGGRLELTAPWAGTLNLGVSGYYGRATQVGATIFSPEVAYDEVTVAADVAWQRDGFLAQGEVMVRTRDYVTGQRAALGAGFVPDGRDTGAYLLVGHRFQRLWNVMPFVMVEAYDPLVPVLFDSVQGVGAGLNFRPTPAVVLKAMAVVADTEGAGAFGELGTLVILGTQAAWVF